jgi:hypothetical protein
MGSLILMLHHHCNHTSQQCIMIMIIYRALHFKLEHLFIIPWLHRYINRHVLQSTSSKIIQVINSEQEYFKQHFVNPLYYPHLRIISSVMNVIDIYRFHDWSQFYENLITFLSLFLSNSSMYNLSMLSLYSSCYTSTVSTISINLLWCDCFLLLLMGDLLLFP